MKVLLADIGGTHVRFALAGENGIETPQKLRAADYAGFEEALMAYLDHVGQSRDQKFDIYPASAGWPDENGVYIFSNQTGWNFDPKLLREKGHVLHRVFNDFEAASYGAFSMTEEERTMLRNGRSNSRDYNRLVCGPGTGLGLGWATPQGHNEWRVQPTFGARMLAAAYTKEQHDVLHVMADLIPDNKIVEFEHVASGRGLILLHQAVCRIYDLPEFGDRAQHILEASDETSAKESLRLFHEFLGLFIHSAAMMTHSYAGVYLNGGMLDRLMEKNLFDFKTIEYFVLLPVAEYVEHVIHKMPVYYVSDPYLALKGLREVQNYGEGLLNN